MFFINEEIYQGMITDLSYLKSLASDDDSFIRDMINIFIEQVDEYKTAMPELLLKADYDRLSKMAHKAKSSLAVMGMAEVADMLQKLEILAQKGDEIESYAGMIDLFITKSDEAIHELQQAYP